MSPALIQAGSWIYKLSRGKAPILKSTTGIYMFPNLDESIEGHAVGLVLPASVTADEKKKFEEILNEFMATMLDDGLSHYDEYMAYSEQVSQGLTKGAEVLEWGMATASMKGGEWMAAGTQMIKQQMGEPNKEATPMDPKLKEGLETAQWVSDEAAKRSGDLFATAGAATFGTSGTLMVRGTEALGP